MSAITTDTRPVFSLRLRFVGQPAENGIHNLRALLKQLPHRGFICLDAHKELTTEEIRP
jgi:hypothetical protein